MCSKTSLIYTDNKSTQGLFLGSHKQSFNVQCSKNYGMDNNGSGTAGIIVLTVLSHVLAGDTLEGTCKVHIPTKLDGYSYRLTILARYSCCKSCNLWKTHIHLSSLKHLDELHSIPLFHYGLHVVGLDQWWIHKHDKIALKSLE